MYYIERVKALIYKLFRLKSLRGVILYGAPFIINSSQVSFGQGTRINNRVFIHGAGGVCVGKNVTLSYGVTILSTGYDLTSWDKNKIFRHHKDKRVQISDNVWIGANTTILSDVFIAEGAVIAAGSVVTKDIDKPNSLYGGVPAKFIREL